MSTSSVPPDTASADPGSFAGLVRDLAAIAEAVDADPALISGEQRRLMTIALAEAQGRLDGYLSHAVDAMDRHCDAAIDGGQSTIAWITARSELSGRQVGWSRKAARGLEGLPIIADAWRIGVLGTPKVRMLLKVEQALRNHLMRDQHDLVTNLAPKTVAQAHRYLARWREGVLAEMARSPDDPPPPPEPPLNSMGFKPGLEGEAMLSGVFDSLTAAELTALTDAEIDRLHREGRIDRSDGKTLAQRRAEALIALARRGARAPEADSGRSAIVINIQVDLAWLLNLPARSTSELLRWPCETADGTPVPLSQVLENLDDATLNLILGHFDRRASRFRPVGEITTRRLADAGQRRMLRARDRTCRYPGCDAPATWAKAHHEPPFEKTHHTTVPELVLLCPHHHRLRHHEGHRIHLEPNGDMTVRTPEGRVLTEPPPDSKVPRTDRPPRFVYRRQIRGPSVLPHWETWRHTWAA